MQWKIGSLFDGSGGFPLAAELCGIEPTWASEVEPYPIAVTRSRFPKMKHLGDISKINGAEIEPVDVITFGSPCQDLSVAGKRAGLKHEANGDEETTRSGLFMEAVRIIKEMREATNGKYPTFALWENVPGAFSSNKGEDFRIVLEEIIKITEPKAAMPAVPPFGWPYADSYVGDGWSVAYRVFDAQYWGVPQRRRRIHLIADFRGQRAREILFEREGLRRYLAQSRPTGQGASDDVERGAGTTDSEGNCLNPWDYQTKRCYRIDGVFPTLSAGERSGQNQQTVAYAVNPDEAIGFLRQLSGVEAQHEISPTILAAAGMSGNNQPCVCFKTYDARGNGDGDTVSTITGDHENRITDYTNIICQRIPKPLFSQMYKRCYGADKEGEKHPTFILDNLWGKAQYGKESEVSSTLRAGALGAIAYSDEQPVLAGNQAGEPVVFNGANVTSPVNGANPQQGDPCHTLSTDSRNYVVQERPVYCLQGSGIDRPAVCYAVDQGGGKSGCNVSEELSPTLTTTHGGEPAVCIGLSGKQVAPALIARMSAAVGTTQDNLIVTEKRPIALDRAFFNQGKNAQYDPRYYEDGTTPTLVARGPSAVATEDNVNEAPPSNSITKKDSHYIVRRLTPTECARLQGFVDRWGDIDEKDNFTDEEYAFWLEVRNTHAAINGKTVKDYTKAQMLTWYKKLHSDSAEYKMWGNGIALPPALYCMQGIREALEMTDKEEKQ